MDILKWANDPQFCEPSLNMNLEEQNTPQDNAKHEMVVLQKTVDVGNLVIISSPEN